MPNVSDFLARVVPWPLQEDPGYVNVHWAVPDKNDSKKKFWSGKATRDIKDMLDTIAWITSKGQPADFYFCLSQQRDCTRTKKNWPKALRNHTNVVSFRAIWIDVDVKPPPKGYTSLTEALDAVIEFTHAAGLPMPNALVASGGGVHVYWISRVPLALDQWQPFADGLKVAALQYGLRCDAGCTSDSVRILRIPGTFNQKTVPPRPVKLLHLQGDYDFATDLAVLPPLGATAPTRAASPIADPSFTLGGAPPAWAAALTPESLAAGLEKEPLPPLPWAPLLGKCAFVTDALVTGGKDYDQPQWNLTTLLATFLENGHGLAHRFGNKHAGYNQESTNALWDRKTRERADRDLGWPSCEAIQAAGCAACATCPRFQLGKSPLNIALEALQAPVSTPATPVQAAPAFTAAVTPPPLPTAADLSLPDGYIVDADGHICKLVTVQKKSKDDDGEDEEETQILKLFYSRIRMPWAQKVPNDSMNFLSSFDASADVRGVSVLMLEMATIHQLVTSLFKQGVKPVPEQERFLRPFMVSWLSKLHEAQAALKTTPFGWLVENSTKRGFVYGGIVMQDDGSERPSGTVDAQIRGLYTPTGDLQPWFDACKLVTDQKRPELDVIVASSFAAPLMQISGEYIGLLSAWGAGGAGKSTAVKVAQAVWAHPKKTKEVTLSTVRSVVDKMGKIRHLPVYWDEIRDVKNQAKVFDVIFGTEGVGPSRLTSNIEQRERADWQTLLTICSNISFNDYVIREQPTHTAGLMRVFEYYIPEVDYKTAPGQIAPFDASNITQKLEDNYGMMGLKYGKFLSQNTQVVHDFVRQVSDAFNAAVGAEREERFWQAICATVIAGAQMGNQLGCEFDIPAMTIFLQDAYKQNRVRVADANTNGNRAE
ncbi:MAG TPA: DUF927 domain-containing protein, partial [Lysobacter sp.]|nr:DUF927 domain-containing protein [Lysobacter sp.]